MRPDFGRTEFQNVAFQVGRAPVGETLHIEQLGRRRILGEAKVRRSEIDENRRLRLVERDEQLVPHHALGVGAEFAHRLDLLDQIVFRHAADLDWHRADEATAQTAAERGGLAFDDWRKRVHRRLKGNRPLVSAPLQFVETASKFSVLVVGDTSARHDNPPSLVALSAYPVWTLPQQKKGPILSHFSTAAKQSFSQRTGKCIILYERQYCQ